MPVNFNEGKSSNMKNHTETLAAQTPLPDKASAHGLSITVHVVTEA